MQEDIELEVDVDISELTRNLQYFCGSILLHYQNVLNDREKFVCKLLIKGHSLQGVSKMLGLPGERVRQIFHKAIKKVRIAFQNTIDEMAKIKDENEKLKHRNLILENELLSEQGMVAVESTLNNEASLCRNAQLLLTSPVKNLPLSLRVKNVLSLARVSTFSEIPLLSQDLLLQIKNCGKKTINDLQTYLHRFNLELGLTYDDVIKRMAKLNDEDVSSDNFKINTRVNVEKEIKSFVTQVNIPVTKEKAQAQEKCPTKQSGTNMNLTIDDICAEIGSTKKSKKKYGHAVKRILQKNNIDTLEKLLALKPSDFMSFEGVGRTTLYHTRKAIESFGFVWSDVK